MPIVINGSGSISGVSVGGLPDGIVDADMLAGNAVTSAKILDGTIANGDVNDLAASKLTGALPALDGSSLTGTGKILQYKYLNFNYSQGTTSNTFAFIKSATSTDFSIALTPSSSSSIIVMVAMLNQSIGWASGSTQQRAKITFAWDIGGAGYNTIKDMGYVGLYNLENAQIYPDYNTTYLHHKVAGTTSEITWKMSFAQFSSGTGGTFSINGDSFPSSTYIMEVSP